MLPITRERRSSFVRRPPRKCTPRCLSAPSRARVTDRKLLSLDLAEMTYG
jgi:hypothetical protein